MASGKLLRLIEPQLNDLEMALLLAMRWNDSLLDCNAGVTDADTLEACRLMKNDNGRYEQLLKRVRKLK